MARNKEEWFQTLKSWVPEWFFEREEYNEAVFYAMAEILALQQAEAEDTLSQTFIDQADGSFLDLLGDERSVDRLPGEFDSQYSVRIKNKGLVSNLSKPALLSLINQLIIKGTAQIKEDWEGGSFFNREAFFNRGEVVIQPIENTFTIVVDKQLHDPYSFFDREYFCDRGDFVGTTDSSEYVFQLILNAVNDNKAFGTLYRIIERLQ